MEDEELYPGRSEVFDTAKTVQTVGKGLISVKMHRHKVLLIFLSIFLLYGSLGLFGYGDHCDTYGMIRSGQNVFVNLTYRPSRFQGCLIPELVIGLASIVGSYYLSNLISAALGCITLLWFFWFVKKYFNKTDALLITAMIALNPYYIVASSSSDDHIYSLFFIFAGIYLLNSRRTLLAAFIFAFAISSRLSNILIIGGVYLYFTYTSLRYSKEIFWKVLFSGIFALFLSTALFIPAFAASGYNLDFLAFKRLDYISGFGRLTRLFYKNPYLFGLLASIFILFTTIFAVIKQRGIFLPRSDVRRIIFFGLVILALQELLFFSHPTKILYLLPILFIVFPVWAMIVNSRRLLVLLLLLTMSFNFVNVDVLEVEYNVQGTEAIGADVGLFLKHGVLVDNLMKRKNSQIRYFKRENLPVKRERTDYRTTDFN